MANETGQDKPIEFTTGVNYRLGQFVGMLSWIDPSFAVDKDGKPTGKKTGDCNFIRLVQVQKGTANSAGFDGQYFQIQAMKTNLSQLRPL